MQLTSDAMGSDVVVNTRYGYRNMYAMTAIYGKTDYVGNLSWELGYQTINNANGVIANIDNAIGATADINRIKGQAMRCADISTLTSPRSTALPSTRTRAPYVCPSIPSPRREHGAHGKPAASINEVYTQALSDLETALTLIPENYSRTAKWKIDRQVVLGLLARTALYARQWQKAKDYSDQLLALNSYLMTQSEWESGFNSVDNKEWIWGHPQTADQSNSSYHFHFLDTTTDGIYYFSFNVDPYFYEKYDDGDYRKAQIFWDLPPGSNKATSTELYMRNRKFRIRSFEGEDGVGDLVLMRVAEIYLINAEARARLNDLSGAVARLNTLRSARGAVSASASETQQQLIDDILLERRRELWGEGFSLVDIIRNQQSVVRQEFPATPIDYTYTDASGNTVHRSIVPQGHRIIKQPDGSNFTANSKYYLFRIPNSEEQANKNLYAVHQRLAIYN